MEPTICKWIIQMGLILTLSELGCFVFRPEQHRQENTLTDELETLSPD
jgi:hypothetical protein